MRRFILYAFPLGVFLVLADHAAAGGQYFVVHYPPSSKPGELQFGVTYTVWIPDGAAKIRAILVHQHGCGKGACKGGETAAYDLHWQALAKKWDCALLGPSYEQEDSQNCRLWCDPRNGSEKTFLKALDDLAAKSKHPELNAAPWCLWGHSGGGFWASLMQTMHPERIVAIWFRSGTAFTTWEKGEIARPEIPEAAYGVPMMCNPGAKENGDKRFGGAWTGALAMFKAYRAKGAPIGFAPDPRTGHECGDCRYLAIPFFDACLSERLPNQESENPKLRPIDLHMGWFATLLSHKSEPAASYAGNVAEAVWLPDEQTAKAWMQYVETGEVSDPTPPPPRLTSRRRGSRTERWNSPGTPTPIWKAACKHSSCNATAKISSIYRKSRRKSSVGRSFSRFLTMTRPSGRCRKCASWSSRPTPKQSRGTPSWRSTAPA